VGTVAGMTHPADDGVWRDDEKLPVSELSQAMASWDTDGQGDPTDNDAGAEQAFGHGEHVTTEDETDETDPDREYRPSTTGRTGPH
jgi:hypothetical protein